MANQKLESTQDVTLEKPELNKTEHYKLEVIIRKLGETPKVFTEIESCTLETISGQIQILPGHAPMTTIMKKGKIKIKFSKQSEDTATEQGGVLELENVDALVKIGGREVEILEVF